MISPAPSLMTLFVHDPLLPQSPPRASRYSLPWPSPRFGSVGIYGILVKDMEIGHLEVLQRGAYSLLVVVTQFFVFTTSLLADE